ncbi:uncharacterized protein LOC127002582 [Eriocheir sinensis]|uniref:uncharacterized protein LOC127002582 n=1 Tax=Eriocheir sinensis TaxID=95602 RepID=UPI0021C95CE9|nr:uncharacterized protein LOC127002582 [Eriocheir sinensis]
MTPSTADFDGAAMERRGETTLEQRYSIKALMSAGTAPSDISRILNINKRTVYRWMKRIQETNNVNSLPGSGGPRHVTQEEEQRIIASARRSPLTTSVQLKHKIGCQFGVQTIRKILHRADIHYRTPAVKPFLSQENKEERLGFALEYITEAGDFWDNVVFCDEKTFSSDAHGGLHCWRPNSTR